jgi:hypothetical protein
MNNNFEFLWNVNGPPVAAMMNVNSNGEGEDHTGVSEEVGVKIPCVSPHGRRMDTCNQRDESRACRDTIAAVNEDESNHIIGTILTMSLGHVFGTFHLLSFEFLQMRLTDTLQDGIFVVVVVVLFHAFHILSHDRD